MAFAHLLMYAAAGLVAAALAIWFILSSE